MTRNEKPEKMSPWVPIHKEAKRLLPLNRPYSELDALFCLQLDHNDKKEVTVQGYAETWSWSRKKVRRFLRDLNLDILYTMDTTKNRKQRGFLKAGEKRDIKGTLKGHIKFIDFNNLQGERDIKGTLKGHKNPEEPSQSRFSEPLKKEKEKEEIKTSHDSRVMAFSEWFCEKYKKRFRREYLISNWGKHGSQVKRLLAMLSWEDSQFIAIEFLLDEDPFLTDKAGHNLGTLLTKIGQNAYSRYLDADFRAANGKHIIQERKA